MPKIQRRLRSADTEVTGVDLHHGALPFLFTTLREGQTEPDFYEWDVDPFTRKPEIPPGDVEEIAELLSDPTELVVFQNAKFDVKVFDTVGVWKYLDVYEFWKRVEDTLMAGHLLASNQPHDLTSMVLLYLGVNIKHYEDAIDEATKAARRIVNGKAFIEKYGVWRIAKEGLPEMPSAKNSNSDKADRGDDKGKIHKFDMWLPRTICRLAPDFLPDWGDWKCGNPVDEHPWWTVCSDYANIDSSSTLPLFKVQQKHMRERFLEKIYRERLKVLPVAYRMELNGVTLSGERLNELSEQYKEDSARRNRICLNIAESYNYDLEMPAGATANNSLRTFFWDVLKLEKRGQKNKELKNGANPSLDKYVLEGYEATLEPNSKAMTFVKSLRGKRSQDTAITFMEGYKRFWVPLGIFNEKGEQLWYCLYPSLNPTGTDTLRWSSSNPNGQNISKKENFNLRYCFGPLPGREWWSCDASNIELRIPAYESGEPEMVALFEDESAAPYFGSYHLLIFDTLHTEKFALHGKKSKTVYESTWYQWTKNGNFAVQYGAQESSGTADLAYHVQGAQRQIQSRFTKITELSNRMLETANRLGYVETIPDKNVDPGHGYPLLCTRSSWGDVLPTVPLSYHVQGTAMWWMMKAMIRCQEFLDDLNRKAGKPDHYRIALQVHDELVFDFPRGDMPDANKPLIDEIRGIMRLGGDDIGIPTPVGCEYHPEQWSNN